MTQLLSEDRLHEIISLVYEAAIDSALWPSVMESLAHSLNSAAITMYTHDFNASGVAAGCQGEVFRTVGFDPAFVASYAKHYAHANVWAQNEMALPEGMVVTSEMLYPQTELPSTEFYGDWLRPQNLQHALGGVIAKSGSLAVKFSALRSSRLGRYTAQEMDFYRRLLPHIKKACQINQRLMHERAMQTLPSVAANQWAACSTHLGILTLSASGQVLAANPRGESLLREGSRLRLHGGRLQASQPNDTSRLMAALKQTLDTRSPAHIKLSGKGEHEHCCITLMPAPANDIWTILEHRSLVLCLVTESDSLRRVASARQLMDLFSLTPAEARLARAIAQGQSLDEYALAEDIQRTTAKTQLQRIFGKTCVASQRELIVLLLALPAIR